VNLKLGHYATDGIEVIDVQGEIDIYTAPRLRELLIDLVSQGSYQLIVNLDEVGFLDSTGLGVLVGGLRRVRAHNGSLDLVCTQQPILKIFGAETNGPGPIAKTPTLQRLFRQSLGRYPPGPGARR